MMERFKRFFFRDGSGEWKAREIGKFGERKAASYLRGEKKFRIIRRNWRWKRNEIDLIAWDGDVLVFIEVRTRRADALVSGYYSVTRKKKRKVLSACKAYLGKLGKTPRHFRFDILEVRYRSRKRFKVNHYENVPLFAKHYRPTESSYG